MVSLGTQPANRKSGFGHSSPTGARAQDLSRQPARPDLWGARVSNDPGLPDHGLRRWHGVTSWNPVRCVHAGSRYHRPTIVGEPNIGQPGRSIGGRLPAESILRRQE